MAEYYGGDAILKRMNWSNIDTIRKNIIDRGFLAFKRRPYKAIQKPGFGKRVWYTNDDLIRTWEVSRCVYERKKMLKAKEVA